MCVPETGQVRACVRERAGVDVHVRARGTHVGLAVRRVYSCVLRQRRRSRGGRAAEWGLL